jgi:hypothetical protein
MFGNIHSDLVAAGTKYKKELLAMPVAVLSEALTAMTIRTGIQGKVVGGLLTTSAELRPYRTAKNESGGPTITPYEWETFLGDAVVEFDPHGILGTLYTELTAKGVKDYDFVKRVALEIAKKVGEGLYDNLFTAVRNPSGDHTYDLFNGFDSITLAAMGGIAPTVSEARANLIDLSSMSVDETNVGELFKGAWRDLDRILRKQRVNLYLPIDMLYAYEDWFQTEFGHVPWNTGFEQKYLIGSNNKCTIVPMDNMSGNFAYFTLKENMNVGVDQTSDHETVRIRECDNPKTVQFFMKAYFGVGFETIQKEYFTAVKLPGAGSGSI